MEQKLFEYQGNILSYSICGNARSQTIVLLPPGIGDSNYFRTLIDSLIPHYHVIAIDFPGVGESYFTKSNTIHGISEAVVALLKTLRVELPIVVGASYGGNVAIEVSASVPCKKLILLHTGEYWNVLQKLWYSLFFLPAQVFRPLRIYIAKKLTEKQLFDFHKYSDRQLLQFCQRWIDVLWYRLPPLPKNDVATVLVHSPADGIVNPKIVLKMKKTFPNHRIVNSSGLHFDCLRTLRASYFQLVKDLLG